ncbi:hypothetical protein ACQ4PT_016311 [Festuca glaucescens]
MAMTRSCYGFRWSLLLSWLCCLLLSPHVASSPVVITHLPGFDGPLPFLGKQLANYGFRYVEVEESNGVHLFYYFIQSEGDPLVLWMQGGPGCSGLTGLAYEMEEVATRECPGGVAAIPTSRRQGTSMVRTGIRCGDKRASYERSFRSIDSANRGLLVLLYLGLDSWACT